MPEARCPYFLCRVSAAKVGRQVEEFMRAAFAPESVIDQALRDLECSGRSFRSIAFQNGVKIGDTSFKEVLADHTRSFDRDLAGKLLDVLKQMRSLQREVGNAPVDWSRTDKVATALALRRHAQAMREEGDHSLDGFAERATQAVK
jgi:hypothetical protein